MKKVKPLQFSNPPSLSQLKSQKKHPSTPTIKKKLLKQSSSSIKHKQPSIKKPQQPQDYIIINDNIYSANTFTERNNYEQFLHKVKKEKQIQRKSFLVKSQINDQGTGLKKSRQNSRKDKMWKKLSPQDFIQTMSLEQKKEMFFKLQEQIRAVNTFKQVKGEKFIPESYYMTKNSQPCSTQSFQNDLSQRKRLDSQRQRKQKFDLIQQKLQNLKMQLMFKWQSQIDRLEQMRRKDKISQKQKQTKIAIIQKLKDHKLKILDCTKTLFEKILREEQYEQQNSEQKANKIQAILQSLHSFPSIESIDDHYLQKQPNIDHLKAKSPQKEHPSISPKKNPNVDSSPLQIVQDNSHEAFLNDFKEESWDKNQNNKSTEDFKSPLNFLNNSPPKGRYAQWQDNFESNQQNKQINHFSQTSQQQLHSSQHLPVQKPLFAQITQKISLKLDLRLDQVIFGQDEYPQCEKDQHKHDLHLEEEQVTNAQVEQKQSQKKVPQTIKFQQSVETKSQLLEKQVKIQIKQAEQSAKQNINELSSSISSPKVQKISMSKITFSSSPSKQQNQDDLACKEQPHQKMNINIPMILSRQKMETLAFEQNRTFRENFDKRIAFQMGCIELQSSDPSVPSPFHFTTLVDINTYIVGFYEFMMKKYMSSLVDNLNIPYGKSAVDKLYSLQTEGFVIEESYNDMNNILGENHFVQYQREIMFTMRKCTEYESSHNRAVFQAFTKCINVYRPYYDLQGEVFPWIVSEKGITFYQITEDNIQQVFEKSKIKVLEYCTALCGLHPPFQVKSQEQSTLMNQKNQQNLTKMIKTQILQHFDEWKIRFVNFQCLIRTLIADKIYSDIVNQLVVQFVQIEESRVAAE